MDKRKAEEQGGTEPFNRMKRDLLVEIAALAPTDRVLVIGTSSEPFNCKRKDEAALVSAFDKHIHVPLPDYASRQVCHLLSNFPCTDSQMLQWCSAWASCTFRACSL
jgi:SpoVK/Ycf46/Vps4 family AAA+-type ATPase